MKIYLKQKNKGFTLVELLLAIGISAFVLSATSFFVATILEAKIKNQTIREVEEQGAFIMRSIEDAVLNTSAINSPAPGGTASSLSLDVLNVLDDPTLFDLSSGVIRVTEGASPAVALSNSKITASNLVFQNLSRPNTFGVVRVSFTLTRVNPEGRMEYNYSKNFFSSFSVRQ